MFCYLFSTVFASKTFIYHFKRHIYFNNLYNFGKNNKFIHTRIAHHINIDIFLSIKIQARIGHINIVIELKLDNTHIISHLLFSQVDSTISVEYIGFTTHKNIIII